MKNICFRFPSKFPAETGRQNRKIFHFLFLKGRAIFFETIEGKFFDFENSALPNAEAGRKLN